MRKETGAEADSQVAAPAETRMCNHLRCAPDKRGGLKGSTQHWLAVYPPEFEIPTFFVAVDSDAEQSRPGPTASERIGRFPTAADGRTGVFVLDLTLFETIPHHGQQRAEILVDKTN